ncbi:MAG: PD-(D/E)XK nuclease family protein, partial [Actinomycetota bacterium]|nr:PD-(D/E)XK nuclease family protein [Actinomycetota bacterium]
MASVAELKAEAPLRAVRVLVPTDRIGVTARRALARGHKGRPGVAALEVLTIKRLAEQLASGRLAAQSRRPLTGPILAGVVREVLDTDPGLFAPVAEHPATVQAIANAHRSLRLLTPAELDTLGTGLPMVSDVVRLHELIRRASVGSFFDEFDLLTAAREELHDATPTVVFLPQDLDRAEVVLLETLAEHTTVVVLAGCTGDAKADAGALQPWGLTTTVCDEPVATKVVTATDPDDEVRHVVRSALTEMVDRPGYRVAILYGSSNPYARLLHEHLTHANVTFNGRSVRPTYELRAGRTARRLFALLEQELRREAVLGLVADAPLVWKGKRAPSVRWERLSRGAGVVRGDDWQRLTKLRTECAARAETERKAPEPKLWLADRLDREAGDAGNLYDLVEHVRAELTLLDDSPTWAELSERATDLWTTLFGSPEDWREPEEQRAAQKVLSILNGVHALDAVSDDPSLAALRDLLDLEMADDLDRRGRAGEGLHLAPISEAVGLSVDRVYIVGLAEGLLPARTAEDPLLPDEVRASTDGVLASTRDRLTRTHRQVLAALGGAKEGAVVSLPRGDLRRGGDRVPSRWVLPSLRVLTGVPELQATDEVPADGVHVVELKSHAHSLEHTDNPAHEQEWHQRSLASARQARRDVPGELADRPAAALAVAMSRARRSNDLTRYDGNLAGETLPDPTQGSPIAPTALETWTTCPHAYFTRYLLGVSPVEEPEELLRISAADRGTVLHDALDRWLRTEIASNQVPQSGVAWPAEARARLLAEAELACTRAEGKGVTGYALLWAQDKASMLADLEAFIDADDLRRAAQQLTPV